MHSTHLPPPQPLILDLKKKKKKADCFRRKEKRATHGHTASLPGQYNNI